MGGKISIYLKKKRKIQKSFEKIALIHKNSL